MPGSGLAIRTSFVGLPLQTRTRHCATGRLPTLSGRQEVLHRIGKPRIDATRSPPPADANLPDTVRWQSSQPLVERDGLKAPHRSNSSLGVHGKMGIPEGALLPFGILLLGLPALRCFSLGVHFFLRKNGFLFLLSVSPEPGSSMGIVYQSAARNAWQGGRLGRRNCRSLAVELWSC